MSTWVLSLAVSFAVGLLWHGLSLKLAVAIAGEDSPGFFRAAWVSWLGGLLGASAAVAYSWTVGWAVWLVSAWLSGAVALAVHLGTTAFVYRRGLGVSTPTALGVTGIHFALSLLVNAALGWFFYTSL